MSFSDPKQIKSVAKMSNHRKVFVSQPSGRHYSQLLGSLKIVPLQQNVTLRPTTGTQTKIQQNQSEFQNEKQTILI